jgi:hypothetical protein
MMTVPVGIGMMLIALAPRNPAGRTPGAGGCVGGEGSRFVGRERPISSSQELFPSHFVER